MKKNLLVLFALLCLGLGTGIAQFTDLYNFNHTKGGEPFGSLTTSPTNVLYGTAYLGGANDSGCVFAINASGSNYRDIFDFNGPNGSGPNSPLTLIGHTLFGSANGGGAHDSGCIFSMDSNGTNYKDLFDFSGPNGKNPYNTLVFDSASGILYGIADGGANHVGCLFSVDTGGGGYRDLFDFTIATGEYPLGLTLKGGKLYGTTLEGGLYTYGLVYSVDTNGNGYKDLVDFDITNGLYPYGAVTYSGGKLFGATADGGTYGDGILFSMDTNGSYFKDIFSFNYTDGAQPEYAGGAPTISGNKLFGTTYYGAAHDSGSIFSIDTNGNAYKDLFDFTGANGANPEGSMTFVGSALYGATAYGGTIHEGVIFTYDTAFAVVTASKDSICPGQTALLVVSGLSGATYQWSPGGETTDSLYVSPASTTTFRVISTKGATIDTNYITITYIPLPIPIITGISSKCKGETDTLHVSGGTTYLWSNGSTQTTYYTGPIDADSNITVTAYNILGCQHDTSFSIAVVPTPTAVITGTITKCKGQRDTLNASGGTTYLWNNGNTTTSILTGPINADSTFWVIAYNSFGCSDSVHFTVTAINCGAGISEIQNNNQFNIFPNPDNGKFTFEPLTESGHSLIIEIYNVMGQKIYNETLNQVQSNISIDISSQPKGIYLYRALQEDGSLIGSGKLVIAK